MHSERPKLYTILAFQCAIGLRGTSFWVSLLRKKKESQKLSSFVKKIKKKVILLVHLKVIIKQLLFQDDQSLSLIMVKLH